MSPSEYTDLFLKAQETGKYHMFIFDIVNSKEMDNNIRRKAQQKMIELMIKIYTDVKEIEIKTNQKILIEENEIVSYENHLNMNKKFGLLIEPFIFGDTFGFTIYRDTISVDQIMTIYENNKKELNIDFQFHTTNGYYETNNWEEGNILFFRGYCIDILSNYHKNNNPHIKTKKI